MHRPRRIALVVLVLTLSGAAASTATPGSARHGSLKPGPWCGGPLWQMMNFSDVDRHKVRVQPPVDTNIGSIAELRPPAKITGRRTTQFQKHAWRLEVIVDRYRIGSDGEIALILYDIPQNRYMNAYLANPHCLSPTSRQRAKIAAARAEFTGHCTNITPSWQLLGITVKLTGIGFWNPLRNTRGALPSGAELRPITNLQIVSGCGVP
jgi:hypothetical protein